MFIVGDAQDYIFEYTLPSPWDISTSSFIKSFSTRTHDEYNPMGMWINPEGNRMYISGSRSDKIHEFILSETPS